MSELQYSGAVGVTNLQPGDTIYSIDSGPHAGRLVRVSVTRTEDDFDGDGVPDQINLKVFGAVVSLDNCVECVGTARLQTPAKVESIIASALAEGTVDIVLEQARMIDECIHRVLRHVSILNAISLIPVTPSPASIPEVA